MQGHDNQIPLRGLLAKHQELHLYLLTSSMSSKLPEGNVEYYILFENHIVDSKTCNRRSRYLTRLGRLRTGLKLFFVSFLPFYARA